MRNIAIKVENLSKLYQLGQVGTGTLSHDLNRFWARVRGKEDPYSKIGQVNDRTKKMESNFVWALKDINFEVNQGEVLGIIGKNGAGKSTLLKILSKITSPSTGKIYTKGRIASLLEVGTGFHPEMTGRENIFMNGAILGMRKWEIEKNFDDIVEFAGIEAYIDTPVKRYSSGMYVRLAFAVAAYLESEILIVDEVLAVGDADFQKKCIGRMKDVSRNGGRTVLFVSHNLAAVNALCHTGILMDNGRVINHGGIQRAIEFYHSNNKGENERYKLWETDAPSNHWCILKSVELINLSDKGNTNITTDDSFAIKVSYRSIQPNARIGMTVIVSDMNDSIIFSSISNHEKNYYSQTMPVSEYQTTCIIPKNFLNAGMYTFGLIVFGPNFTDALDKRNILNFEILDGIEVRGYFQGLYGGVIRPLLEWETIKI